MKTTASRLALICVALSVTTTQAAILSVDFNGARGSSVGATYTGNGVLRADGSTNDNPALGTPTGHWDGITFSDPNTPSQSSGLLNSSGAVTSGTISFANWGFQDNCPGCGDAGGDPANQSLLNDYLGTSFPSPNPSPTVTIGGLTPSSHYSLYIYGTNGGSGGGGTWSVNGSPTQVTLANGGTDPFVSYANGEDYVHFSVTSDLSGDIVITGSSGPGSLAIFNGFQLSPTPAPEPASLILSGLGAIGLLVAVRRRRKA